MYLFYHRRKSVTSFRLPQIWTSIYPENKNLIVLIKNTAKRLFTSFTVISVGISSFKCLAIPTITGNLYYDLTVTSKRL